jgi:uncharacterized membrane protein YphA (DoxX/SURF4 family)
MTDHLLGTPSDRQNSQVLQWLSRSKIMAVGWTAMRLWLGIMWIQAGAAKLWGKENPAFLHNGGAGVAGFAAYGAPAYTWWGRFLHGFVVPNAGWIAVLVAVGEFAIGIALVAGLFTRLAARQSGVALHLRRVWHGECLRVLRTVRPGDPGDLAHIELARSRRPHLGLSPAPPASPAPA